MCIYIYMYICISNDIVQMECDTWLQSMYLSEAMNARKSYSGGKRPINGCGNLMVAALRHDLDMVDFPFHGCGVTVIKISL